VSHEYPGDGAVGAAGAVCVHAAVQFALDGDDTGDSGVHPGDRGDHPVLRGGQRVAAGVDHSGVRVGAAGPAGGARERLLQLPHHPGGHQPREPGRVRDRLHLPGQPVLDHLGGGRVRDGALGHHRPLLLQERRRGRRPAAWHRAPHRQPQPRRLPRRPPRRQLRGGLQAALRLLNIICKQIDPHLIACSARPGQCSDRFELARLES
jgi:hypothetical protein